MDSFPAPQDPQSAPSSYLRPIPGQLRGHSCVVRDAMFPPANAAGNRRPVQDREDIPPPVENIAGQGQPQDLRYIDMGYYDVANDHRPLHEHRNHAINNRAGVALDVPAQGEAVPPAPIDIFDGPARDAAAGPAPAFLNEWPPQDPVPNVPANEVLRQLAILYLREPNSQVAVLRMEPSHAHGVRVFITLELGNL
ncbi:hypothetical protein DFH94DRAFT_11681 [Russula ochroleuca]|uniref:Uncharacterized protein n=1 Tax=Russula ochroleuca TaxID=152965 RepID=A0A9P5N645_9AGAM|nr:hypothetical protein DFH94DRAFT_11681 [Russula ochroleuca]